MFKEIGSCLKKHGDRVTVNDSVGAETLREDIDRTKLLERLVEVKTELALIESELRGKTQSELFAKLTLHQLEALWKIKDAPIAMKDLAQRLGISESSATALANRLVRSGLVRRFREADDRRVVKLELTEVAYRSLDEMRAARTFSAKRLYRVIDNAQLQTLVSVLEEVVRLNQIRPSSSVDQNA
jgi:DNA-binding MarR family transcriptional regulator